MEKTRHNAEIALRALLNGFFIRLPESKFWLGMDDNNDIGFASNTDRTYYTSDDYPQTTFIRPEYDFKLSNFVSLCEQMDESQIVQMTFQLAVQNKRKVSR